MAGFGDNGVAVIEVKPQIIGEGRVVKIDISFEEGPGSVEIRPFKTEDPESPIMVIMKDAHTGHFIVIYDHREKSREAFSQDPEVFRQQFAANVPCLCGFRIKRGQYVVLADIGTEDMKDGGPDEALILTEWRRDEGYSRVSHRVMGKGKKMAMHQFTGIRLLSPRQRFQVQAPPA